MYTYLQYKIVYARWIFHSLFSTFLLSHDRTHLQFICQLPTCHFISVWGCFVCEDDVGGPLFACVTEYSHVCVFCVQSPDGAGHCHTVWVTTERLVWAVNDGLHLLPTHQLFPLSFIMKPHCKHFSTGEWPPRATVSINIKLHIRHSFMLINSLNTLRT